MLCTIHVIVRMIAGCSPIFADVIPIGAFAEQLPISMSRLSPSYRSSIVDGLKEWSVSSSNDSERRLQA